MKRMLLFIPVLLLAALLVAQTPAKPQRATQVRGEAVGRRDGYPSHFGSASSSC